MIQCPACATLNFEQRTRCYRCSTDLYPKPERPISILVMVALCVAAVAGFTLLAGEAILLVKMLSER
jgi:uncharacterized paraquat-inducible protein A